MTRALLALLLILGQLPVAAATRRRAVRHPAPFVPPEAIVAAARQAAQAAMNAGVPAVQIAVSERGQIIYSEAFGVTDKTTATAATPRSVLRIASITKQFTAAAILRLAERGALILDDPVEKYVPEFDPRGAKITLRHLLNHTSGLPRDWYAPTPPFPPIAAMVTREQSIKSLNAQALIFTPGSKWSYSNAAYLLLGYAIESITGRPFAEFFQSEFALPLGLIDTGVCGTSNLPLPDGYAFLDATTMIKIPSVHTSGMVSSGALCSTASDLARWAHLLASGQAILPDSYVTMTTPARLNNNALISYGLGVGVQYQLGHPAVLHDGAVNGFQSFLIHFSDKDIAVAVIVNTWPGPAVGNPQTIAMAVANAALAEP
jgi:CubicO group peptidase (beta-lactamase class C family)